MNLSHRRTARRLAVAGALLLLAGCAAIEASRRLPATVGNGALTPARPAATHFGPDAARTCPVGGAYGELYAKVAANAKAVDAPQAVADPRLCAMAEALLGWSDDDLPGEAVVAGLSQYFGLPAPANSTLITDIETEDVRQIAQRLAEAVASYSAKVAAPAYGVATNRLSKNKTKVVLVLQNAAFTLDPLPRRLEPGQKATVSGALAGDAENPKVLISDSRGKLTTVDQAPGKAFKAELACERPGRMFVEIRGEEMGNERAFGNVPVTCGLPLPAAVPLAAEAWPSDAAAVEKKMADLVNAERVAAGLPALAALEPLGKIARAVSEAMRDSARKGGVNVPVNVVQRLNEADVTAPVILQNTAAGPTAATAHELILTSPARRADVMSAEVTHLGIGVASGVDAAGRPMTFLTQLFIKVQPPPDVAAMRQEIVQIIARKRASEKLAALTAEAGLEKLASAYAAEVAAAGGPPGKAKTDELVKALNKGFKDIVLMVDARLDANDYAEDPNVLAKGKLLGFGAALGRHPRLGKNTLFVVLIIANKK